MKKLQVRLGADAGRPEHDRGSPGECLCCQGCVGNVDDGWTYGAFGKGLRVEANLWFLDVAEITGRSDFLACSCGIFLGRFGGARDELLRLDGCGLLQQLREHRRSLGHVPLIDHNPRKGEKIEFKASEAQRYKKRSQTARTKAGLKDDDDGRFIRVRGNSKVMLHLMFGMLALTANQVMRLLT